MKSKLLSFLLLLSVTAAGQKKAFPIKGSFKAGTGLSFVNDKQKNEQGFTYQYDPVMIWLIGARLTGYFTNKVMVIMDLGFGNKGGAYTVKSDGTSSFPYESQIRSVRHPVSLIINIAFKTSDSPKSFFFGGGPALDMYNRYTSDSRFSGGLNLLGGYRFESGFSAELNFKTDLFLKSARNGPQYNRSASVTGFTVAYEF